MSELKRLVQALKALLPKDAIRVEYNNDVGPDDDGYWEWWDVAGVRFGDEESATAFVAILNAVT